MEDTPEDWVHDLLLEAAWPGHPLGRPVVGRRGERAGAWIAPRCGSTCDASVWGENLIVSAAGRVDHDRLVASVAERSPKG